MHLVLQGEFSDLKVLRTLVIFKYFHFHYKRDEESRSLCSTDSFKNQPPIQMHILKHKWHFEVESSLYV